MTYSVWRKWQCAIDNVTPKGHATSKESWFNYIVGKAILKRSLGGVV